MKKILIPVDFSQVSRKALEYAGILARKTELEVTLLHTINAPYIAAQHPEGFNEQAMETARQAAAEDLKQWCEEFSNHQMHCQGLIRDGFVVDSVLDAVKETFADLVILGTTGASGWVGNLIGSNASAILNRITKPVLLIPHEATVSEFKNILYATQLEEVESEVLQRVFEFAGIFGSTVDLIKINTEYQLDVFNDENIIKHLHTLFPDNAFNVYKESANTTVKGIEHYLETNHADLIIMTTSRQSFIERLFNGSVTRQMALHTHIPLLVYHKEELPHF